MSWQKCPVCAGSGLVFDSFNPSGRVCPTCKGQRIVNEITGKPPEYKKADKPWHQTRWPTGD